MKMRSRSGELCLGNMYPSWAMCGPHIVILGCYIYGNRETDSPGNLSDVNLTKSENHENDVK
jgi:hypothetical protein